MGFIKINRKLLNIKTSSSHTFLNKLGGSSLDSKNSGASRQNQPKCTYLISNMMGFEYFDTSHKYNLSLPKKICEENQESLNNF